MNTRPASATAWETSWSWMPNSAAKSSGSVERRRRARRVAGMNSKSCMILGHEWTRMDTNKKAHRFASFVCIRVHSWPQTVLGLLNRLFHFENEFRNDVE